MLFRIFVWLRLIPLHFRGLRRTFAKKSNPGVRRRMSGIRILSGSATCLHWELFKKILYGGLRRPARDKGGSSLRQKGGYFPLRAGPGKGGYDWLGYDKEVGRTIVSL